MSDHRRGRHNDPRLPVPPTHVQQHEHIVATMRDLDRQIGGLRMALAITFTFSVVVAVSALILVFLR